jgi:peptidylprolyl isomerase
VRSFALIAVSLLTVLVTACGGGNSGSSSKAAEARAKAIAAIEATRKREERVETATARRRLEGRLRMSKGEVTSLPKLKIEMRNGPAPKRLVVRDLRKGTGAPLRPHDAMLVNFFSVSYGEAQGADRTGHIGPSRFGLNEVVEGWEIGLVGMRVGGRRELIVPPNLGYRGTVIIYVIDLLAVYPDAVVGF